MRRALLVVTGLWAAIGGWASCTPAPPLERQPVELALQVATRQSCGVLSGLDYETSCLAAVSVRVLDDTGAALHESCELVKEPRPTDLRGILRGPSLFSFSGLSANRVVVFEVAGLHDKDLADGETPESLCANPAQRTGDWLFWGESDPIDLAAYDGASPPSPVIPIVVDCRDCTYACGDEECFGCLGLGEDHEAQCSAEFPPSFCVPVVSCDKACDDEDDCFEGARACVEGRCDVEQIDGRPVLPVRGRRRRLRGGALLRRARSKRAGLLRPRVPRPRVPQRHQVQPPRQRPRAQELTSSGQGSSASMRHSRTAPPRSTRKAACRSRATREGASTSACSGRASARPFTDKTTSPS
jgi:hypothetical protein